MIISKALFLESRSVWYDELVKIIGKAFIDRIRFFLITPLKVIAHQRSLKKIQIVLTYYRHSSMTDLTDYGLINQVLFSSTFSVSKRLNILSFQYLFLYQQLTSAERDKMVKDGITCWTKQFENCSHTIVLKISQRFEYEGCLSLLYCVDQEDIYIISFTICSGVDFGLADERVILISRIQGAKAKHEEISKAAKQLIDIFPASALMSGLEGFGLSLQISKIVCIAAKNQVSIKMKDLSKAVLQYDEFWKTFEATPLKESGGYLLSIPFAFKSEKLIRSKFRKRTLAKRAQRNEISEIVQANCEAIFQS